MIAAYYDIAFLLSLVLGLVYMYLWHRHFDIHITMIFLLVPVVNLGYALLAHSESLAEALNANRLTYVAGCYLQLFLMLAIFSLCDIRLRRGIRLGMLALSTAVYVSALSIGEQTFFYRSVSFALEDGAVLLTKDYSWMHTVFYALVCAYFLLSLGAIVYSWLRKNQVSRKTIFLLFLTELVSMVAFFGGRRVFTRVELLPGACDLALVIYLVIVARMGLYDISETAVNSLAESGQTGFLSFDYSFNYLGSNETARRIFPALETLTVDLPLHRNAELEGLIRPWLESFRDDPAQNRVHVDREERSYLVVVNGLFDGRRKRGYQLTVTDDTQEQQYIKLLNGFNDELKREVAAKTERIVDMHDQLILGMATMVESRDNSTGGHIRRTSEGVRLLTEALRDDPDSTLSESFCRCIVKAAPMHDLGKIAVDDDVLRKPGRFTAEEFEKMKTHAAEGARIVREILKGTDDTELQRIAENVAHYHHERWDGSGYPEGLRGEEIPPEARIMAVADVYDALVSKRVYKEKMPPEKANEIILEGMGSQFDPGLRACYLAARPALEAYYAGLE